MQPSAAHKRGSKRSSERSNRKSAEQALRESETRLELLVRQMPAILWTVDTDVRVTAVMGGGLGLLGIEPKNAVGKTFHEFMGQSSDAGAIVERHRKALAGDALSYEASLLDRTFHVQLEPLRDAKRRTVGVIGLAFDITDHRAAQDELRKSRRSLASAQSIARLGNWDYDFATDDLIWSEELCRIYGFPSGTKPGAGAFWEHDHPEDADFVRRIIDQAKAERRPYEVTHRIVREDGDIRWVHERGEYTFDDDGKPIRMVGTVHDITERREAEQQLAHLAHHDALTDLPNRTLLADRLQQAIARARRLREVVAVLFIDLDRFKNINDTLGHAVGDRLLKAVADRIAGVTRAGDTVARPGGDEFVAVLTDIRTIEDIAKVAQKILRAFADPCHVDGHELFVTASIGISIFPNDGDDVDALVKNADRAMYQAKESGRNTFQFYAPDMLESALERLALETDLRKALDRDQLTLYYQPLTTCDGTIVACEALLRWRHPTLGLLLPNEFISLAEETGLIVPIGEWVIREATRQMARWRDDGRDLRVLVNISARQFQQRDLADAVEDALASSGLEPARLELEITESAVMRDADRTVAILCDLKNAGVRLSIDDFGTGYSSLGYLKRFPIDVVKIDRSFVRDVLTDKFDEAIARAVVTLAHSLELAVVAEGVETERQLAFMREIGCDLIQGFLVSRPLTPSDFIGRLS